MKICFYLILPFWLLAGAQTHSAQTKPTHPGSAKYVCLPEGIKGETTVEAKQIKWMGGIRLIKETVIQRLDKMNARCRAGKLRDQKGREIRFFRLRTCWGNPPADYLEIQEAENNALQALRKKFTVIEITCNPAAMLSMSFL